MVVEIAVEIQPVKAFMLDSRVCSVSVVEMITSDRRNITSLYVHMPTR